MIEKLVKINSEDMAQMHKALLYAHEFDLANKLTGDWFSATNVDEDTRFQVPNGSKSVFFPDGTVRNVKIIKAEGVFWVHYRYLEEFEELVAQMREIRELVCPDEPEY